MSTPAPASLGSAGPGPGPPPLEELEAGAGESFLTSWAPGGGVPVAGVDASAEVPLIVVMPGRLATGGSLPRLSMGA